MANIFRTKEVYKKLKGVSNEDNPLRAVRGVYVCGDYTAPYYISSGIRVSDIQTTKATVVNYTERKVSLPNDHVLNVLEFSMSTEPPTVQNYTIASKSLPSDHVLNVLDFTMSTEPIDIVQYTKGHSTLPNDHVLNVLDFTMSTEPISVDLYSTNKNKSTPEPTLRIKSIEVNKATIENVVE